MKTKILLTIFIIMVAFTNSTKCYATEINTTLREEVIIEDEAYQLWKTANTPVYGNSAVGDYSDLFVCGEAYNDTVQYLYQYMDKIPQNVIEHIRENGWKIYLVQKAYLSNVNVSGYSAFDKKEMYISLDTIYNNGMTLCHEIGHIVYRDLIAKGAKTFNVSIQIDDVFFHDGMNIPYICFRAEESLAQGFYEYIFYPLELQEGAEEIFKMYNDICNLY